MVDNILRRYIQIGGVESLVFDKILKRYILIGSVEPLVVDILRFWGLRVEVICGKVLSVEAAMVLNSIIPCKKFKITHNYLILLFYCNFWFTFSSFQGTQS